MITPSYLQIKPAYGSKPRANPLKLNLDPIFQSRELVFQGTISEVKH